MFTVEVLEPIFQEVFADPSIRITRQTTANDIDEWDSLTHMNLVLAVELRFKIKFALGELQTLTNVGDMLDLINRKTTK